MKRILTLCMTLLFGVSLLAQTNPERVVVYEKSMNMKGYLAERIDSIMIKKVEGEVRADVQVLNVAQDKISFAITRTTNCPAFKFLIVAATMANHLTDDAVAADYIDKMTQQVYYQDFTNGEYPTDEIKEGSDYVAMTVGIDQYNTLCGVSRSKFSSYKTPVVGNPQVTATATDIKQREFTVSFTPNADVAGYAVLAGKQGEVQAQYEQMGAMFGFANFGDMVKGWGVQFDKAGSYTWTDMEPGTLHEVFIQAWDANGTLAECQTLELTTEQMGGDGDAAVKIELGDYKLSDWNGKDLYGQTIYFTPNDQSNCYRVGCYFYEDYKKDPEAYHSDLKQEPPMPNMIGWFHYEPFTNEYQINPGTECVAIAAAKNANGEWGEVTTLRFTPTAENSTADYARTANYTIKSRQQKTEGTTNTKGKIPSMPLKREIRLTGN